MLSGDELCARLPHVAPMCLLDRLVSWDPGSLVCRAGSHRDPRNPLCRNGRLAAVHAIEYACQAAALHAALATHGRPGVRPCDAGTPRSLLAAVKNIVLAEDYLDQIPDPLRISAWRELALGSSAIYRFLIEAEGRTVADGRLTLIGEGGV